MIREITPKELKKRLDAGEDIDLIDVREDWELLQSRLDQAIHIPMYEIPESLDRITKEKPVVIMCHLGQRSAQVVYWMQQRQGYTNLYSLEGGIDRWAREVDPSVEKRR
jgi:rhodanese-related sulfurtransferase